MGGIPKLSVRKAEENRGDLAAFVATSVQPFRR